MICKIFGIYLLDFQGFNSLKFCKSMLSEYKNEIPEISMQNKTLQFPKSPKLTKRQAEILSLIAQTDATQEEIGNTLFISPATVKRHEEDIRLAIGATSRCQLIIFYYQHFKV
jgi:DNA-binding NarL/FixJ family response regulator